VRNTFKALLLVSVISLFLLQGNTLTNYYLDDEDDGNLYNGWYDRWENWVPGYITNDWWMTHQPNHTEGKMVWYSPEVMRATAEYRGIECEECIGYVSLMSPIDIGRKVWIKIDEQWYGPFMSVDCAKKGDMYSIVVYRDEVVEIGFDFARELGMVSVYYEPYWYYDIHEYFRYVEVWLPPINDQGLTPPKNLGEPTDYSEWYLENLEFATKWEPRVIQDQYGQWKEFGRDKYWLIEYTYKLRAGHGMLIQRNFYLQR
jgi:hypothetical protein